MTVKATFQPWFAGERPKIGGLNSWEGCHQSRRCSRNTYSESYITKYTSIRRFKENPSHLRQILRRQASNHLRQILRRQGVGCTAAYAGILSEIVVNVGRPVSALYSTTMSGLGFEVEGLGFRVVGLGFGVGGLGFRLWGLGVGVESLKFSV